MHNAIQRQIKRWLCFGAVLIAVSAGCTDVTIPACQQAYSNKGDREAVAELVNEFRQTVAFVREKENVILLSGANSIGNQSDLLAMESWVCRAQTQYGSP